VLCPRTQLPQRSPTAGDPRSTRTLPKNECPRCEPMPAGRGPRRWVRPLGKTSPTGAWGGGVGVGSIASLSNRSFRCNSCFWFLAPRGLRRSYSPQFLHPVFVLEQQWTTDSRPSPPVLQTLRSAPRRPRKKALEPSRAPALSPLPPGRIPSTERFHQCCHGPTDRSGTLWGRG